MSKNEIPICTISESSRERGRSRMEKTKTRRSDHHSRVPDSHLMCRVRPPPGESPWARPTLNQIGMNRWPRHSPIQRTPDFWRMFSKAPGPIAARAVLVQDCSTPAVPMEAPCLAQQKLDFSAAQLVGRRSCAPRHMRVRLAGPKKIPYHPQTRNKITSTFSRYLFLLTHAQHRTRESYCINSGFFQSNLCQTRSGLFTLDNISNQSITACQ